MSENSSIDVKIVVKDEPLDGATAEEDALLDEAICGGAPRIRENYSNDTKEDVKHADITRIQGNRAIETSPTSEKNASIKMEVSDYERATVKMEENWSEDAKTEPRDSEGEDSDEEGNGRETRKSPNSQEDGETARKRLREESLETQGERVSRNRRNSGSSSSTASSGAGKKKIEHESDPAVLARRQKDIDYGKNTIGYDRYIRMVPKDQRTKEHPKTPPKYTKYSRRGWDGMVKLWRKQLHHWDPPEANGTTEESENPLSF